MGNKQDNISLIAGDNIVINYDNNSSWTIEADTTIMKTQTLNTSTINSSTMNSSSLSVVNLITCNDLNVGSVITSHTASFRTINSSYCNSLNASFAGLNASTSNISNITIGTLNGQNTNSSNMNASIFNSDDITCEDFTLDTNGIMKIKSNNVRGQLSSTNNKFNISCSTSQYISLANGNSEICNIYSDKVNINVSTNISGALNASYYMPITSGSVSSDNMRVEEFFVNDTGIITFSAGTGGSGGGSIKTLPNEGLNISCGNQLNKGIFLTKGTDKKIEIEELVKINVSTNISGLLSVNSVSSTLINSSTINSLDINASNVNVSTFNIGTTNFTTINTSTANMSLLNISSLTFIALDITRETNSTQGGCMIQLEKSHITGQSPETPWRFGPSGTTAINNHFVLEPNNVPNGRCFDLDINGVLKLSAVNAIPHFENRPDVLSLKNPITGYLGGHFGKYLSFNGVFHDTPTPPYNILLMPRLNDSYRNNLVIYDTARQLGVVINHSGNTGHAFKVNGSCFCTANAWSGSDDRIKYNEEDVEGLNVIRKLNPKKYDKLSIMGEKYIDDSSYNSWMPPSDISFNEDPSKYEHSKECGLIAQDILDTDISYCVNQDTTTDSAFEMYSVDYNSIFTYAIQAIKELDVKMNNLEAENSLLLSRVAELENNI